MGSYTDFGTIPQSLRETFKNGEIPLVRAPGLTLVLNTSKGRGVFAKCDIPANTIVDISPVLVLSPEENVEHISKTELFHYTYNWPLPVPSLNSKPQTTQAIILGLGSLFNHSTQNQNIGWTRSLPTATITYTTLRAISAGEELCISYGSRLTFVDVDEGVRREADARDLEPDGGLGRIELD